MRVGPALVFIAYVVVLVWAFEIVRRLGDQTKLLRRIAQDVAALRAAAAPTRAEGDRPDA